MNKLRIVHLLPEEGARERFLNGEPYGTVREIIVELPSGQVAGGDAVADSVSREDLELLVQWATFPKQNRKDRRMFLSPFGYHFEVPETEEEREAMSFPRVYIGFSSCYCDITSHSDVQAVNVGFRTAEEVTQSGSSLGVTAPYRSNKAVFDGKTTVHELVEWEKNRLQAIGKEAQAAADVLAKAAYDQWQAERRAAYEASEAARQARIAAEKKAKAAKARKAKAAKKELEA